MAERKPQSWSQGKLKKPRKRRRGQERLNPAERRRATQLMACLLLFAVVFVGRGLPSGRLAQLSEQVGALIHQNTDFVGVFSRIGHAVSEGEPVVETFGQLWDAVLGSDVQAENPSGEDTLLPESQPLLPSAQGESGGITTGEPMGPAAPAATEEVPAAEETFMPETVTPVMGVLTSGFGYREHPMDGEWKEHQGVDLAAEEGTPILAYAAGTVDYIGESEEYGLYLQLKHDDGVTTFYAHCKDISVAAGQSVAAGETIGTVGETGKATGPHLHFEMKRDGSRVDPAEYIEATPLA